MNEPSLSIRALLDRGAEPRSPRGRESSVDPDEGEEYQAFAGGRIGNRTQWTLVFQRASGAIQAFPYAQFDGLRSDAPEQGFVVTFAGIEVEVSGSNLGRLVRAVCDHRAALIVETTRAQALGCAADAPLVAALQIRRGEPLRPISP